MPQIEQSATVRRWDLRTISPILSPAYGINRHALHLSDANTLLNLLTAARAQYDRNGVASGERGSCCLFQFLFVLDHMAGTENTGPVLDRLVNWSQKLYSFHAA